MARPRSRGSRLSKRWGPFSAGSTFAALSAGSAAVVIASPTAFLDTILRTRGQLLAYMDGASAPGKLVDVAVGMIVQQEGLVASGQITTPITDSNADWFWYVRFALGYEEMVTDVVDVPGASSFRMEIDSKAMRKAPPDTEVALVAQNATLLTAGAVNIAVGGRLLLGQ